MKNDLFQRSPIQWILFGLALSLLACGQLQIGLEGTATPEQNLAATIAALQTEKAQLAAQVDQTTPISMAAATSTSTPSPTPSATLTPLSTPTPPPPPTFTPLPASAPPTATPLPVVESQWTVRTLLVFPGVSGRLYALQQQTDPSLQLRLLTSDDFGQSWAVFPGALPVEPSCLYNLNLDYATLDALYTSTCRGLYRWSGTEWIFISPQETGMVAIAYGQLDQLWATTPPGLGDSPVLSSANGGQAWTPASRYLSQTNGVATLAFDPQNTHILYAVIRPEYAGSYLRRGVASGQWETLPMPRQNAPLGAGFTLDGSSGALYVISAAESSQLWRSPNPTSTDGNTLRWEQVYEFGPGIQAELLASGWSPQGLALYANLTQAGQPVLHRSENDGQTWTPLPIEF